MVQQHHHAAAAAAANLTAAPVPLPLHPAAAAANHLAAVGTSRAAPPVAAASAPSASSSAAEIHPLPKRMKMDLQHPAVVAAAAAQHVAAAESRSYVAVPPPGPPAHRPPPVAAAAPPPSAASSSLSTPLRIDTREAVKVRQKEIASSLKFSPSPPNQNSEPPAAAAESHNLAFVHVKLDGLSVRPTVHSAVIFSPPSVRRGRVPSHLGRQQNFKSRNLDSLIASLAKQTPNEAQCSGERRLPFSSSSWPQLL